MNNESHIIGETIIKAFPEIKGSMLDADNILWRFIDGKFIGKRSVQLNNKKVCWLEDTQPENVKNWSCGRNADYSQIFYQ